MSYKLKIGLEIHVQVNTKSKLFSTGKNEYCETPNINVVPFDMACPGALPRLNEKVLEKAIVAGKILNCEIQKISKFDRKHYNYPDLPLGYQITQFYEPICINGYVNLSNKQIRINRIHIESDAGKLIHSENKYYIDYNRCGCPLLEIVTEPDFSSIEEVEEFLRKLIRDFEYGNVSDCAMEKGNLRCDINISVYNDNKKSERVEIKNVNSVEFIKNAIEYEFERQVKLTEKGEKYNQHTRGYNNGETIFMRNKETVKDYRYYRCGNIPTLKLTDDYINSIKVPETYDIKYKKYMSIINNKEVVNRLLNDKQVCEYFENGIKLIEQNKITLFANLLACDLMGLCKNEMKPYNSLVTFEHLASLVNLSETIPTKAMKNILKECFDTGKDPKKIAKDNKLGKITNENEIENLIKKAKEIDSDAFEKFAKGDTKVKGAIVGIIIKLSDGQVDVAILEKILITKYYKI